MTVVLVKTLLAPLVVLVASTLANRLGPQAGGLFIGLPTTSLPFVLTIWLARGDSAAVAAAAGGVSGQLTCAIFCAAYARFAPSLRPVAGMLAALATGAVVGLPTLALHAPVVVLSLSAAAAVAGLLTWPIVPLAAEVAARRRSDIPVRMAMASLTVVVMSSLAPVLGNTLAGALATLPTILMVMCPSVAARQGAGAAVALAHGTLGSIPGTAAYLCAVVVLGARLGILPATVLGLVLVPATRWAIVTIVAHLRWRRRPTTLHRPLRIRPLNRSPQT